MAQPDGPLPPGPLPISATQANRLADVIVTFDQPLVGGVSAKANWHGRAKNAGQPRSFGAAVFDPVIAGAVVTVDPKLTFIGAGAPQISYDATPADVVSLATGIPALPFLNYPVT